MRVRMNMQSTHDWSTREKAQAFIDILISQDDFLLPEKYDDQERARFAFDASNLEKFIEIWTSATGWMFLKRTKPFALSMIVHWWYREHQQLNELMASIDERYLRKHEGITKLSSTARDMYAWGAIAHGYICHEEDWNKKNYFGVPTRVGSGKAVSTGGLRLQESLPSIYWANFFGPIYVDFFGRSKFLTVPAYYKQELKDGGFLVLTSSSPLDYGRRDVQLLEESIIDHLGRDAFFEKAHPAKVCRAPQFSLKQATLGEEIEVQAFDDVRQAIPNPYQFIEEAPELANMLVGRLKGKLDYSPDSLAVVDDYIHKQSYRRPRPWTTEAGRRIVQELVAYYGEVLRRNLGGKWNVVAGTRGYTHPAVVFIVAGREQVEYPFARLDKFWEERQRADGLSVQYFLIQSGERQHLEQHLNKL